MYISSDQLHNARILVVDDHLANVDLLSQLLEDQGYAQVDGLTDPRLVMDHLRQHSVDLILLDIRMPHVDGFALLELIRTEFHTAAPPIIVLTAQTDMPTRHRALELGARDFLTKPFDYYEVLQRIHNQLDAFFLFKQRSDQAALLQSLVEERTEALKRLSLEDPVTGLPNRRALLRQLTTELQQRSVTLLFVALEGVEELARLHGYDVTDQLMRQLAARLQTDCCEPVQLTVWNSTEWVLIPARSLSMDELAAMAVRAQALIARPLCVDEMQLYLQARIGVVDSSTQANSAEELIRFAALALPAETGHWRCYQPQLADALQRRNHIRHGLRRALEQGGFTLVYQPKLDLSTQRVVGAEALLRWQDAELGPVSPAEFIPVAEQSGDILHLGNWVVDTALTQLQQWRNSGQVDEGFILAINVAARQLMSDDFARYLQQRCEALGLPSGCLELEVTESGLMQDIHQAREHLQQLSAQGFSIAIDDFGTGYSSLAYLKNLPVSVLKIDRAFVKDMDTNLQDQRLAETVIQMAHGFGCQTVAEGVENATQAELLHQLGCELVQGFWFSPPLGAEAFITFYKQGAAAR